jgi:Abortive infection alpha
MDEDTIGKLAEATGAASETVGKAIDAVSSFGRIFKGPVEELVGCVEDKFKYVRWQRRLALIEKAEAIMKRRGIQAPTRELPLSFSVPLLTHAILEESDELQETWARLLVNAGDGSTNMELRVAYVSILAGLSAFDVRNLSVLAEASIAVPRRELLPVLETWNLPSSVRVFDGRSNEKGNMSKELGVSLANLFRLGCVVPGGGFGGVALFTHMTVTDLGEALYLACT